MTFVPLTGEAGGGRGERLIILRSFKSITIPIYKRTTDNSSFSCSYNVWLQTRKKIGNKTIVSELYKTG